MGYGMEARLALRRHDFHFSHKLGQNFLLDEQVLSQIVDAAQVKSGDCILEIGPGAGTMTAEMASRGAEVLAQKPKTVKLWRWSWIKGWNRCSGRCWPPGKAG